jgi:hypothetical protein
MEANGHQRKLSRRESAVWLCISVKKLDRDVRSGALSSLKLGGKRQFTTEALASYELRKTQHGSKAGEFSAVFAGDQQRKALERFLLPLVRELMAEEYRRLVGRIEALERAGGVHSMEVAA